MSAQAEPGRPTSRGRSSRPPASWDAHTGPVVGVVELPLKLYWSDDKNRFDLADEADRRLLYQVVLAEGTADDIRTYLHLPTLLAIWDTLWLPVPVHEAWDRWVAARHLVMVSEPLGSC